jgi:hypothetical protein
MEGFGDWAGIAERLAITASGETHPERGRSQRQLRRSREMIIFHGNAKRPATGRQIHPRIASGKTGTWS